MTIRAGLIASVATAVAVLVAVAVSPAFPIGTAAGAEPEPGLRVDVGIVAAGALVTGALCLVAATVVERLRTGPDRSASVDAEPGLPSAPCR